MPAARGVDYHLEGVPARWIDRSLNRWHWKVRADWASLLLGSDGPDWLALANDHRAARIKANDGREVWRIELSDELAFCKVYMPARGWDRLRRLVLGSDATRERRIAEYARKYGIATVEPVAAAEGLAEDGRAVSLLITAGLPDTRPLNEVWSALDPACRRTRAIKNTIIDRVARLIAHAHQNGFEHTDLHAGNVLIDQPDDSHCRALFVDLHNIRIGRPVSDEAVIRNLAQFNQWFRLHTPLSDRLRFLDRYLHWRSVVQSDSAFGRRLGIERRPFLRAIEHAAQRHANALYSKRDRRVQRTGRYFSKLKLQRGWRGHVFLKCKQPVPGSKASELVFTAAEWQQLLSDPLRWTTLGEGRYAIKKSASGTVCRAQLCREGDAAIDIVAKRSRPRHFGKRIKNLLRRSRAIRTWRMANALLNRQIPTARPLAVAERRTLGMLRDSVIITEHIDHAHDLDTVLTVQIRELDEARQRGLKRQIAESLAMVVRRFQARGFVHRDFKAPNIMVQWDPRSDESPRVLLVDLDGIRQKRQPGQRDFIRAIMRLNVSVDHCRRITRTDRLRFLQLCLARPGCPEPDIRAIWQQIADLSQRKRKRKERQLQRMMAKYGRG